MRLKPPKRFWLPKQGNRPEEYEDASLMVYSAGRAGSHVAKIALSDGASESSFAREWAQALTQRFIDRPPPLSDMTLAGLSEWMQPCQERWHSLVPWDKLPWHGEAKTRSGALATLVGLTVAAAADNALAWRSAAVGDTCLFVVRDDALLLAFPLESASQFDNTPSLLCSNPANNAISARDVHQTSGLCQRGDRFILATDALSRWFLESCSGGGKPWDRLLELESESQWREWVEGERSGLTMRNDDMTLVTVEVV